MWLNSKEEKIIGNFLQEMENAKQSSEYEIQWENSIIYGSLDTIYEDDNMLEIEDPNYEEFWTVLLRINKIIKNGDEIQGYKVGDLIEINYHNAPKEFKLVQ